MLNTKKKNDKQGRLNLFNRNTPCVKNSVFYFAGTWFLDSLKRIYYVVVWEEMSCVRFAGLSRNIALYCVDALDRALFDMNSAY